MNGKKVGISIFYDTNESIDGRQNLSIFYKLFNFNDLVLIIYALLDLLLITKKL